MYCITARHTQPGWEESRKRTAGLLGCGCAGTVCLTLATLEGDEVLDPAALGSCAEVCEDRVGDWDYLFFRGCKTSKAATVILRVRQTRHHRVPSVPNNFPRFFQAHLSADWKPTRTFVVFLLLGFVLFRGQMNSCLTKLNVRFMMRSAQ